jgi:RNA polymerase sigma-70 factor (ECF subfamily)
MVNDQTEKIWNEFGGKLKGFIAKRVNNGIIADDILQDVFVKIHSNLHSLKDSSKLQSWIYQITRNTIIDYHRSHRINYTLPDDLADIDEPSPNISSYKLASSLKKMILLLPPKYSEALLLTEFEGLTQVELARKLRLSVSGAKSRVQRGREMLKEMLYNCCHFEFDRRGAVIDYHPVSCCCCFQYQC